jgi:hypothetical protein
VTTAQTIAGLLADEDRRRVFAAVALGARTADEIAEQTGLDATDVRALLPRLVGTGVLEQREGLFVATAALREAARARPPRNGTLPGATPAQEKALRNFVEGGRITQIPMRASQRAVLVEYLASRFEPGVEYGEPEVNERLLEFHDDYAALRRYLVDADLLHRAGGRYVRSSA